jgi:hypothetical protein
MGESMFSSALKAVPGLIILLMASVLVAAPPGQPVEAGLEYQGHKVQVHLPETEKKKNIGGSDGAGLCVFTSIEYAARLQNARELFDLQSYMHTKPGGGYPSKVASVLKAIAPNVQYIQDTTGNEDILELALKTGREPSITYDGYDTLYHGYVAHMVGLVYLDKDFAAITDNNRPADARTVWMKRSEFTPRFNGKPGEKGWSVILLDPPPPPLPVDGPPNPKEGQTVFGAGGWGSGSPAGQPSCPNGMCPTVVPPQLTVTVPQWKDVPGEPEQIALMQGTVQLGSYSYSGGYYRPLLADGSWGLKTVPPIEVPARASKLTPPVKKPTGCSCGPECTCEECDCIRKGKCNDKCPCIPKEVPAADLPTGVIREKVNEGHHQMNGKETSLEALKDALIGGNLADDSSFLHLTAIGTEVACLAFLKDTKDPSLASYMANVHVQQYRPTDWPIRNGFRLGQKAITVYLTQPDGTVLARVEDYQGVPTLLDIFKPKPKPIPVPPTPDPLLPDAPTDIPLVPLAVIGAAGAILYFSRKKA